MKKEIVIAIILGLTLGIIITFGVYRARTSLMPKNEDVLTQLSTDESPVSTASASIVINHPEDESIVAEKEITVTGTTTPNAMVVVLVNDFEYLTTADSSGNFSVKATLDTGSNVIVIHSVNEDGNIFVEERTVIFSTASLDDETPEEATPAATPTKTSN